MMPKQITLKEALKLVSFYQVAGGSWRVLEVNGEIHGDVNGEIYGDVNGNVRGYVDGNVNGNVCGTINGRKWKFVETPKDKLQRLITKSGSQELIDAFNQMEDDSND